MARSYHAVQERTADEYGALSKYSAAVSQIESLEKEVEGGAGIGITFHLDSNSNYNFKSAFRAGDNKPTG